jgi:hypothetical protein
MRYSVEYIHAWIDSSTLSGHILSFSHCTVTASVIYGVIEQGDEDKPELTLDGCHITNSNSTFHTLNISTTAFFNSPLTTPLDGKCDITYVCSPPCPSVSVFHLSISLLFKIKYLFALF